MVDQITPVILTFNEEANLPGCLDSLNGLDCEVFVVDSGSTDRTLGVSHGSESARRSRNV